MTRPVQSVKEAEQRLLSTTPETIHQLCRRVRPRDCRCLAAITGLQENPLQVSTEVCMKRCMEDVGSRQHGDTRIRGDMDGTPAKAVRFIQSSVSSKRSATELHDTTTQPQPDQTIRNSNTVGSNVVKLECLHYTSRNHYLKPPPPLAIANGGSRKNQIISPSLHTGLFLCRGYVRKAFCYTECSAWRYIPGNIILRRDRKYGTTPMNIFNNRRQN